MQQQQQQKNNNLKVVEFRIQLRFTYREITFEILVKNASTKLRGTS